jgi:hypothetical protein
VLDRLTLIVGSDGGAFDGEDMNEPVSIYKNIMHVRCDNYRASGTGTIQKG